MGCGTLNQNEAVCRDVSLETDLLQLFGWVFVVELGLFQSLCHCIIFPLNCPEIEALQRLPKILNML